MFRDIAGDPAQGMKSTLHQTGGQVQLTMMLSLKRKKNLSLKCSEYVAYIIHTNIYFKKKQQFLPTTHMHKKLKL